MKRLLKIISGIILIILIGYFVGPKPPRPVFEEHTFSLPSGLDDLEKEIDKSEKAVPGLKPDNQARIVWADTANKAKTKIAFLYIHGFSASQEEGDPVHRNIAEKYKSNLYLSRLQEHGIDRGDSTMINLDAESYEESAEKALAIAKMLGDEVIIIGTSAGGALTTFMASRHPEIKAIILYSPCIELYDKSASLINKPWGLQILRKVIGNNNMIEEQESPEHGNYWQLNYRLEGLVALQNFISNTMKPETFYKVTCPVFLGYYYKSETEQDMTVSVPAMLKMFDELGTPSEFKVKTAFPETGAHVLTSPIRSKDWQSVETETNRFLSEIVKL